MSSPPWRAKPSPVDVLVAAVDLGGGRYPGVQPRQAVALAEKLFEATCSPDIQRRELIFVAVGTA